MFHFSLNAMKCLQALVLVSMTTVLTTTLMVALPGPLVGEVLPAKLGVPL